MNIKLFSDMDCTERTQDPECLQKPHNHTNYYNCIQYTLDGSIHRNIIVDEPEQHSNDDQDDKHTDE